MAAWLLTVTNAGDKRDELVEHIQSVLPAMLGEAGCTGGKLMVDGKNGKIIVLTCWRPEGMVGTGVAESALRDQLRELAPDATVALELMDDRDIWAGPH